jgi:hypothetical protein
MMVSVSCLGLGLLLSSPLVAVAASVLRQKQKHTYHAAHNFLSSNNEELEMTKTSWLGAKEEFRHGESNPGLPRDRRGY